MFDFDLIWVYNLFMNVYSLQLCSLGVPKPSLIVLLVCLILANKMLKNLLKMSEMNQPLIFILKTVSKKIRHSEIENSIKSTILNQSIWNFVKITISWLLDVAGKSAWLIWNCGCYTIFNFWECLIFFDSDFSI